MIGHGLWFSSRIRRTDQRVENDLYLLSLTSKIKQQMSDALLISIQNHRI